MEERSSTPVGLDHRVRECCDGAGDGVHAGGVDAVPRTFGQHEGAVLVVTHRTGNADPPVGTEHAQVDGHVERGAACAGRDLLDGGEVLAFGVAVDDLADVDDDRTGAQDTDSGTAVVGHSAHRAGSVSSRSASSVRCGSIPALASVSWYARTAFSGVSSPRSTGRMRATKSSWDSARWISRPNSAGHEGHR